MASRLAAAPRERTSNFKAGEKKKVPFPLGKRKENAAARKINVGVKVLTLDFRKKKNGNLAAEKGRRKGGVPMAEEGKRLLSFHTKNNKPPMIKPARTVTQTEKKGEHPPAPFLKKGLSPPSPIRGKGRKKRKKKKVQALGGGGGRGKEDRRRIG